MATNPNTPREDRSEPTRLYLLLLALVYVTYQHPALADPLSVGGTAAAVLVTGLGFAVTRR